MINYIINVRVALPYKVYEIYKKAIRLTWKSRLALTIFPSLYHVIFGVGVPVTVVTKRAGVPSGTVRSAKGLTAGGTSVISGTGTISHNFLLRMNYIKYIK